MDGSGITLEWWIRFIELPILAGLFKLMWDIKKDLIARIERIELRHAETTAELRAEIASFKPEVARGYVPIQMMRELDRRMSMQLIPNPIDQNRCAQSRSPMDMMRPG